MVIITTMMKTAEVITIILITKTARRFRIRTSFVTFTVFGQVLVKFEGTRWCSWLRHCAKSRKVTVSIPRWCHWNLSFT
jgi:hypothetical protein